MIGDGVSQRLRWPDGLARPMVLGHRGASLAATENTLPAFEKAMQAGAEGVELDVQLCRTGEPIVFHDEDLRRLAGRPERISALTWDELREVRLSGDGRIPTLPEALAVCGPKALINIELKCESGWFTRRHELIAKVALAVERADGFSRIIISSFSPWAVWQWARRYPNAGYLFESVRPFHNGWPIHPEWLVPWIRPMTVHPEASLCTANRLLRWHRRGLKVIAWTVDAPQEIQHLCALGVDGIITNDPRGTLQVLSLTQRSTVA